MGDRPLPWQRLERGYYADDDLVLARRESGLIAEVLFTRFLAHGKPIRVPQGAEGEVFAGTLGFDPDDAPMVGLALDWFVQNGTIKAKRKPGPISKGTRRNTLYDLTNRSKYRPPDRFLTRSERTPNSEKPQVDSAGERDASVTRASRGSSRTRHTRTDVRTNVRTNEKKPLAPPAPDAKARRAAIFEAIADAVGWDIDDLTDTARGALNKAAKELDKPRVTPEEITQRAERYRNQHSTWDLSPSALCKWWPELGGKASGETTDKRDQLLAIVTTFLGEQAEPVVAGIADRFPLEGNALDSLVDFCWLRRAEYGAEGDEEAYVRWNRSRHDKLAAEEEP